MRSNDLARLGRAYRRAEARALRRYIARAMAERAHLGSAGPLGDLSRVSQLSIAAERTADAIAARIASIRDPRSAAVYRADNGLAHRAARLALGMER